MLGSAPRLAIGSCHGTVSGVKIYNANHREGWVGNMLHRATTDTGCSAGTGCSHDTGDIERLVNP